MKDKNLNGCTPFQREIVSKIIELSKDGSFSVTDVDLMGIKEHYVYLLIKSCISGDIDLWLYKDECMLKNKEMEFYFEKYDFDDADNLQENLFILISNLVSGESKPFRQTFRKNLLKGGLL